MRTHKALRRELPFFAEGILIALIGWMSLLIMREVLSRPEPLTATVMSHHTSPVPDVALASTELRLTTIVPEGEEAFRATLPTDQP